MPRPKAYRLNDGTKVCGATTPIGKFDAGGKTNNLMDWAQRLAVEYEIIDGKLMHVPKYWRTTRDGRGDVGTLTHALWSNHLDPKQKIPDLKDYTQEQQDESNLLHKLLMEWLRKNPLSIISVEEPYVSHEHKYAGTPDVIDTNYVVDVKTGFVNEFSCMLQLSAYAHLALENGLTKRELGGIIIQPYNRMVRPYYFSPKTLAMYFPTFLALLKAYKDENKFNYMRKKKK